jgi:hypothetical protein
MFDPYHKWLGIPPDEQPANHYRLLGLRIFETDLDVIESAADRQMAHVQTHKTGPHSAMSQKLLNELAAARLCLLDAARKSAYDQTLRPAAPAASTPQVIPAALAVQPDSPPQVAIVPSASPAPTVRRRRTNRPLIQMLSIAATVVLLVAAVYLLQSGPAAPGPVAHNSAASSNRVSNAAAATHVAGAPKSRAVDASPATVASAKEQPTLAGGDGSPSSSDHSIGAAGNGNDRHQLQSAAANSSNTSSVPVTSNPSTASPVSPAVASSQSNKPKRLPAPTGDALEGAKSAVDEMFLVEINQAKTPAEQHAIARRLFDRSFSTDVTPAVSHELLRRAAEIAAAAGRYDVASEAIDTMAGRFETDAVKLKTDALKAADRFAKSPSELRTVVEAWTKLGAEATSAEEFLAAQNCFDEAVVVARKTSDKTLLARAVESAKEAAATVAAFDEAAPARQRLQSHPGDPQAAVAWGRFLCLYKNDWDNGLLVWGRGLDELAAVARQDLARPPFSPEQIALADRWWDAGEAATEEVAKKRLRLRAAYWYRYAKLGASRGEIARIQERIELTEQDATAFPIGQWVDLLKTIDLKRHVREGNWESNGNLLVAPAQGINYVMAPVVANGSYELEAMLTFGPKGGTEVNFFFPVGSQSCAVILFGWNGKISGLHQIDGRNSDNNETTVRGAGAVRGQRFKVLIQVELAGDEATISIDLNGRKFIRWQGAASRLSVHKHVALPNPSAFAVRSWHSALVVHSLKLRVQNGVAKAIE